LQNRTLRNPFLPFLAAVLVAGIALPGPGRSLSGGVAPLIVGILFLMSFTLPFSRLSAALRNGRALGVSLGVSWVLVPLLAFGAARVLYPGDADAATGLLLTGALPVTLASAAVWTRTARGNDAIPVVFTAISNALTFAVAPAILLLTLSTWVPVDAGPMGAALLTRVLAPVVAGQIARAVLPRVAERIDGAVGAITKALVLVIVLVAVSGAADSVRARPAAAAGLFTVALGVHLVALGAAWAAAAMLGLSRADRIGVAFAGSQKSLYVGVYLATAFYPDRPAALLPVLAYHVMQLVADTVIAERLRKM
jgi:sodium/bile acid cotransporter 7